MLLIRKPDQDTIRTFLSDQASESFSYLETGSTDRVLPSGYAINHTRVQIGQGEETFLAACSVLQTRQQLQLKWVSSWPKDTPVSSGENVAVIGKAFGLWWLNACRVVYTIEHKMLAQPRFGYAHGTLPDHLASGEERFLVEMKPDESVWFDILAFSRPNTLAARLGYPYMRLAQKRFGRQSAQRILEIVSLTTGQSVESLK